MLFSKLLYKKLSDNQYLPVILKKLSTHTKKLQAKEILVVQKCLDHRINTYDEYHIFETYILKQKKLLEN